MISTSILKKIAADHFSNDNELHDLRGTVRELKANRVAQTPLNRIFLAVTNMSVN